MHSSQLRSQAWTCLHGVLAAAPGQARAQGIVLLSHHTRALPAGAHVCQPRLRQAQPERNTICTCNPARASSRAERFQFGILFYRDSCSTAEVVITHGSGTCQLLDLCLQAVHSFKSEML